MQFEKKKVALLVLLTAISIYLTIYTVTARSISSKYIHEDSEKAYWRTSPSGSLFPWPEKPGVMQMLSEMNETDLFIYNFLIKTGILAAATVAFWVLTLIFIYWQIKPSRQ